MRKLAILTLVIVGAGKRLFSEGVVPSKLKLTKFKACPSGAFMNFYQQARSVAV